MNRDFGITKIGSEAVKPLFERRKLASPDEN